MAKISLLRKRGTCLVFALLSLSLPAPTHADLYEFVNGGILRADGRRENGVVRFEIEGRSYAFPENAFRRIVPGFDWERAWKAKLDSVKAGSIGERLDAALWALEHGRVEQASRLVKETIAAFPNDIRTIRLASLLKQVETPKVDPETSTLKSALLANFNETRTPNLLFLHQGSDRAAQQQSAFLERMVLVFYLEFGLREIPLEMPSVRMVCVEWGKRDDYRAFLRSQNAGAFHATTGFFHPTFRAIIGYQSKMQVEPRATGAPPTNPASLKDPIVQDLQRRELLKASKRVAEELSTSAHEMIHMLVSVSGLLKDPGGSPLWLQEGLAMQYEYIEGNRWAGINRVQEFRLQDWRNLRTPPDLLNVLNDSGFGKGYNLEAYAKSWALVYFLRTAKPHEFQGFLDRLNLGRSGDPARSSETTIEFFRQSFGSDLKKLQREWRDFLAETKSDTEESPPR